MLKSVLVDFAKLCSLSYLPRHKIVERFNSSEIYLPHHNESVFQKCLQEPILYSSTCDCQVYVCQYDDYLSICFRGTESIQDILTDINIFQAIMVLPSTPIWECPNVHNGFYQQFYSVLQPIQDNIRNYISIPENTEKNKIVFSGHSLGGALATIAALYFSIKYPNLEISCLTFGSPRVGNSKFVQLFDSKVKHSFRYVNDNDPVPCIPTSWRYQHVKGLMWLNQDKIQNEISVWRFYRFMKNTMMSWFGYGYNALEDHSCDGYVKDLDFLLTDDTVPRVD